MLQVLLKMSSRGQAQAGDELELEEKIRWQLQRSGERERLKQLLTSKLEATGWKEEVRERCREFVAKQDRDVSTSDIVQAVRPAGRSLVPDSVKVGVKVASAGSTCQDTCRCPNVRDTPGMLTPHVHGRTQAELLAEIKKFILSL